MKASKKKITCQTKLITEIWLDKVFTCPECEGSKTFISDEGVGRGFSMPCGYCDGTGMIHRRQLKSSKEKVCDDNGD